jgi:hypothetical protein
VNIHDVYFRLMRGFRRRRMARFLREFGPVGETSILDVGGAAFNWQLAGIEAPITLLNLRASDDPARLPSHFSSVAASGTALPYADASFGIVFSNSVIEHVGDPASQSRFAAELRRVVDGLWVQTPARAFPLEPHLLGIGIHYLPRSWQRYLVRYFTGWGWLTRPSPARVEAFLGEIRLLDFAEFRQLFPDCEIRRERFLGLTKAYVAVRPRGAAAG